MQKEARFMDERLILVTVQDVNINGVRLGRAASVCVVICKK